MKKINLVILFAFLISLSLIANISALENNANSCLMGGVMYGFNGSYGSGTMILSWTVSILLIVLIIAGIYWFIKSANNKTSGGKK
ncbi:MAG: hypothetical protein AABX30_01090 [Nanoarchaeota archaeon]